MKKFLILCACILLMACQSPSKDAKNNQETIYTSFFPIYNLTKEIAGDNYQVKSFMPLDKEVHDWEPSAKDIKDLSQAKCLIINGAGLESWVPKVQEALPDLKIVDLSQGLDLIKADHTHSHDHGHDHHHEETENHDHAHEHHHHDHGNLTHDPHSFLSPVNGQAYVEKISSLLQELDPDHKADYQDRAGQIEHSLQDLTTTYQEKFAKADVKTFIVPHQAFGYLARDFGLKQHPLQGLTSLDEPDLKTVQEAIETCQELGVKAIFYNYGSSPKAGQVIADEAGVKLLPLATMETQVDEKDTYVGLMEENLKNIAESLGL